ncbi:MAG: STAS domain-containing protein [Phycisphaerales bacterium]|nr:STAS domain-containing protein [Phycisphaerales bacterium]
MPAAESHINVTKRDGVDVVEFVDRKILDELSISELGDQLRTVADATPAVRLILDFARVEHLSSAALGMLITLDKLVKERNGKLRLCNINPQIFEVFKITRLNKMFEIRKSVDDAMIGL